MLNKLVGGDHQKKFEFKAVVVFEEAGLLRIHHTDL